MIKIRLLSVFLFTASIAFSQEVPATLTECYILLDKILPAEERESIKESSTPDFMTKYHMGIGLYIRNAWIRHGNPLLVSQINYKPWKVSVDDYGAVALEGYWHYLHGLQFDWSKQFDASQKYYDSYGEPGDFPEGLKLEKQNEMYFVNSGEFIETVHVYKSASSDEYWIYIHSRGWQNLSAADFLVFVEEKDKLKYWSKLTTFDMLTCS